MTPEQKRIDGDRFNRIKQDKLNGILVSNEDYAFYMSRIFKIRSMGRRSRWIAKKYTAGDTTVKGFH